MRRVGRMKCSPRDRITFRVPFSLLSLRIMSVPPIGRLHDREHTESQSLPTLFRLGFSSLESLFFASGQEYHTSSPVTDPFPEAARAWSLFFRGLQCAGVRRCQPRASKFPDAEDLPLHISPSSCAICVEGVFLFLLVISFFLIELYFFLCKRAYVARRVWKHDQPAGTSPHPKGPELLPSLFFLRP